MGSLNFFNTNIICDEKTIIKKQSENNFILCIKCSIPLTFSQYKTKFQSIVCSLTFSKIKLTLLINILKVKPQN